MINREVFYEDIKNRAQDIYEQYKYLMKEVLKIDINLTECQLNIYINDDMNLGGKAWCQNNIDNIQINKGVIDNFFDYFYTLTKRRTEDFIGMFSTISDENEMEEVAYEGVIYDNDGNIKTVDSRIIDLGLASLLNIFVARFIITHELGHLLNGHCSHLNSKMAGSVQYIPTFYNKAEKNNIYISALDMRTLEMDADAFAATDNCRNLITLYNKFEEKVDSNLNIQPIDLFYWWSFAIRSNFLLMQYQLKDNYYKKNMKYLPSVARWSLIISSIDEIINKDIYIINYRNGDNKEKIMKAIVDGSICAERYFNKNLFTEYNWIEEILKDENYVDYIDEINENWENISKQLSNFSRLPLYNN